MTASTLLEWEHRLVGRAHMLGGRKREKAMKTLYHGTTPEAAEAFMHAGWEPGSGPSGGNCGQPRFLYLSTEYDDALWFSEQKGCSTVVELRDVPLEFLAVDPEDGVGETVAEEITSPHGLPGKLVLTEPLPADHFSIAARPGPRP